MKYVHILTIVLILAFSGTSVAGTKKLKALDEKGRLQGGFVALEGHFSILSDLPERSMFQGSFGYGARGGYRWNSWGIFATFEHNLWVATEYKSDVVEGAINIGVGADLTYAHGFVRTSLALGPSILAFDTILDDAGSTGLFIDFRPIGLNWAVHDHLSIGLDPITFALVAPVLDGIPLIFVQYRTMLYLEYSF
jgi:hypothetical protein